MNGSFSNRPINANSSFVVVYYFCFFFKQNKLRNESQISVVIKVKVAAYTSNLIEIEIGIRPKSI